MNKKFGFTLIEVLTAAVIIGIASTLASVSYSSYKSRASDGRRKEDVNILLSAAVQYGNLIGNNLISAKPSNLQGKCTIPDGAQVDALVNASGNTCAGAGGRGFGKVNLRIAKDGDPGTREYTYGNQTINQALISYGLLTSAVYEPALKNQTASTTPEDPDYVLIRACSNGQQHIGSRGNTVVVWTLLKTGLSSTSSDRDSISKLAGYPFQLGIKGTQPGETYYHYEFAAKSFDQEFTGASADGSIRLYGVGNSININEKVGSAFTDCQS